MDPVITKEVILHGNELKCGAFLNRIIVEMDMKLEMMQYLDGVKMPYRSVKDPEYNRVFDETAKKIYEVITGRPCPKSINID